MKIHPSVSVTTLKGLILDSVGPGALGGLHIAIAHGPRDTEATRPLPPHMTAGTDHHFLAVWFTCGLGPREVS